MLTHLSLRRSLPLLLGLGALLFSVLLVTTLLPRSLDEAQRTWRNHVNQSLILLQSSLADHLRQGRQAELENDLADLASLADVRWAMVLDGRQQVIAATRLGLRPGQLGVPDQATLAGYAVDNRSDWLAHGEQRFLAIYPLGRVDLQGAPSGEVLLVSLDFAPVLQHTRSNAWLYLGQTLLLLLLLGLLLNYLYSRLVTRRLARLEQAARRFASGQLQQPADVDGTDEIGQLAATFNQMMVQLQARQAALQESEELLRKLIDAAPVGMLVVDDELRVIQANPAAAALFGCAAEELLGQIPEDRLVPSNARQRLLQAPPSRAVQLNAWRGDEQVPLEISLTPFLRHGQSLRLVLLRDISERLQAEQRLRFLAHFDPLTHLANRNYVQQRLEQLLDARCPLSLLFLDIDHFKRINDSLGHEIGDRLLVEIAERLGTLLPERALLARSGGDEFVLLLEGFAEEPAMQLAERLCLLFEQPFRVRQYQCRVSASIGLAVASGQPGSASELLKQVDLALYAAKDAGRNRVACFTPQLAEAAEDRQQLEEDLRQALQHDELVLHYQAKVDGQGRVNAMEALLRWQSPGRGLVPPNQFIPVLEESGLIIEATRWVFRQACRQARLWAEQGASLRVAVNLSPLDFRQSDLAGSLLQILAEEGAESDWLELEITESALLDADASVLSCLQRLRAAGLPLFLDDFGTGYASLSYLRRFPFDGIKIDRQFVSGLPDCTQSVALVRGMLTMAHQLGLQVVAEGVENERQAAFLRLNGCNQLQGFYYARPLPAAQCQAQGCLVGVQGS